MVGWEREREEVLPDVENMEEHETVEELMLCCERDEDGAEGLTRAGEVKEIES